MDKEQKDEMIFRVAKCLVRDELEKRTTYFDDQYHLEKFRDKDLDDARCLVRMIKKEVDAHNASIQTKRKLVENLKYTRTWKASKLIPMDLPWKKIDKVIEENPEWDYWKVYQKLRQESL